MAMERPGALARRNDGQRTAQAPEPEQRPGAAEPGLKTLAVAAVLQRELGDVDDALRLAHRDARRAVRRPLFSSPCILVHDATHGLALGHRCLRHDGPPELLACEQQAMV